MDINKQSVSATLTKMSGGTESKLYKLSIPTRSPFHFDYEHLTQKINNRYQETLAKLFIGEMSTWLLGTRC